MAHRYIANPQTAANIAKSANTMEALRKVIGLSSFPNTPSRRQRRVSTKATTQTKLEANTVGTLGTNEAATAATTVAVTTIL
mmetsp:Transcript_7610/g.21055  ORF Transcript_7610/g.21055 Transcript_7610/m.21055 type:complete len:82 (+) Transcript_7610:918-1163(+)